MKRSDIQDRLPPDVRLRRLRWDAAQAEAWRGLLPEGERTRLADYGVEKRQREFLMGRAAARQLLAQVLGCAPQAVRLAVTSSGAVEVRDENRRGFCLSISHTKDEAVAAVARRAVGVDMERIAPRSERLHRFLLADEERPLLERLPLPTAEGFILCWTLKEAALKALRCGLLRSPKTFRLSDVNPDAGTARLDAGPDGTFEACFARDGRFWLAVAYDADDGRLTADGWRSACQ